MKKILIGILLLILCIAVLSGCGGKEAAYSRTDFCFDTAVTITIYDNAKNSEEVNALLDETIELCKSYDSMFSRTKEGSDLWNINHSGGEWTSVSDETIMLLQSALDYCTLTGGEIDITIASVKDLWDFSGKEDVKMPSSSDIEAALTHVDYTALEIQGTKVRLADPEASVDLGFIAKGYIADHVRSFLLERGVKNALINLGGNIVAIGTKPDGAEFTIGVQEPFSDAGKYITTVTCSGIDSKHDSYSSIVTSGIYERSFTYNNKLYHHILDTSTGFPVHNDLSSVTILTDSSLHADALSTTCLLLGAENGVSYIENLNEVEAIFITTDGKIIDTRE